MPEASDRYTFSVERLTYLVFSVSADDFDPGLELRDAAGSVVGEGTSEINVGVAAGEHTLRVYADDDTGGDYDVMFRER